MKLSVEAREKLFEGKKILDPISVFELCANLTAVCKLCANLSESAAWL